jgi:trigger factor
VNAGIFRPITDDRSKEDDSMSVQVEKLEKNTAKLTIEVPAEEFDNAMQEAYKKEKKNFSIPGFRKGKVPKQMIEKMYGPEIFYEEAANILLSENYPKSAEESGLRILSRPEIDVTQIKKGEPFIYTAVVAVYPEFEIGNYKGIEVPIQNREVTDEDLQRELDRELEKNSRTVTVEDRPAEMGDICNIDYAGTIDGVAFDGGTAEGHDLELGSNTFIPGFEEQLVGVSTGEEKDVKVTFPEDYHAEDLKGKEAVFHCKVNKIQKKEIPALDDEFAQDVSEFDTLEEYKEDLKKQVADRKKIMADNANINAAIDYLVKNTEIELSDLMISEQADNMFNNYANNFAAQGMSMDQYLKMLGQTADQLKAFMKPEAEQQLKAQFILEKVAELEKLEATDEQVDEKLGEMAKSYGMELEKLKEIFSEDYLKQFKDDMKTELAGKFLGGNAVETEAATKAAEEAAKAAQEAAKAEAEEKAE